jgi:hypothetical protein
VQLNPRTNDRQPVGGAHAEQHCKDANSCRGGCDRLVMYLHDGSI